MDMPIIYSLPSYLYLALHMVALAAGLAFWRKCPNVCLLVVIGAGLNILAAILRLGLSLLGHFNMPFPPGFVHLGISMIGLVGTGLYVFAIFKDRTTYTPRPRPYDRDDDDDWHRPIAPAPGPGATGIQEPKS